MAHYFEVYPKTRPGTLRPMPVPSKSAFGAIMCGTNTMLRTSQSLGLSYVLKRAVHLASLAYLLNGLATQYGD